MYLLARALYEEECYSKSLADSKDRDKKDIKGRDENNKSIRLINDKYKVNQNTNATNSGLKQPYFCYLEPKNIKSF